MRIETLILDREHRVHEVRRHLRQRHLDALFLEDREDRTIGDVVEHGRLGHVAHAADLAAARQGVGDVVGEPGDGHDQEPRHRHGRHQRRQGQPRMGQGGQPHAIGRTPAQGAGALRGAFHERWQGDPGAHRRVLTIIRGDGFRCPKTCSAIAAGSARAGDVNSEPPTPNFQEILPARRQAASWALGSWALGVGSCRELERSDLAAGDGGIGAIRLVRDDALRLQPRQEDAERRALSRRALDRHRAGGLADDAVHDRQAEPGALPRPLGREERLEEAGARRRHPCRRRYRAR